MFYLGSLYIFLENVKIEYKMILLIEMLVNWIVGKCSKEKLSYIVIGTYQYKLTLTQIPIRKSPSD